MNWNLKRSSKVFVLNLTWELLRAGARHVFCFFMIYLALKFYLSFKEISKVNVLNIQPLTAIPGLDYDLPLIRQRNLIKIEIKQLVVSIKYSLHAIKIYNFDSLIIIFSVIVGVVLRLFVESFGGFKDQ